MRLFSMEQTNIGTKTVNASLTLHIIMILKRVKADFLVEARRRMRSSIKQLYQPKQTYPNKH